MNTRTTSEVERLLRDGDWFARIATALFGQGGGAVASGDQDRPATIPWTTPTTPQDAVARMRLRLELLDAVLALDEPYRSAVVLRFLEGRSFGEVCRITQASEECVRAQVERGLAGAKSALRMSDPLQ
jgi:DNA-directed RNA polymerase specialized sigma24 family protein